MLLPRQLGRRGPREWGQTAALAAAVGDRGELGADRERPGRSTSIPTRVRASARCGISASGWACSPTNRPRCGRTWTAPACRPGVTAPGCPGPSASPSRIPGSSAWPSTPGACRPAGLLELREAIAKHIAETRGIPVAADEIVVTPGAKPIMFFVVYPSPAFPNLRVGHPFRGRRARAGPAPGGSPRSRGTTSRRPWSLRRVSCRRPSSRASRVSSATDEVVPGWKSPAPVGVDPRRSPCIIRRP
jgi:hypothetical protein